MSAGFTAARQLAANEIQRNISHMSHAEEGGEYDRKE